jgi:hypothetical protein
MKVSSGQTRFTNFIRCKIIYTELGAMNFYRADFRQLVKDNIAACISTGQQCDFEAV